jgi:hypothetical protein
MRCPKKQRCKKEDFECFHEVKFKLPPTSVCEKTIAAI